MRRKKTILMVSPMALPIPAVGGGAIEQLITYLLESNEQHKRARFVVISPFDKRAAEVKYSQSIVYYFDQKTRYCDKLKFFRIRWQLYQIWLKVFRNHIVTKIIPEKRNRKGMLEFLCWCIAQKEKVNAVSFEGRWDETSYAFLTDMVGKENVYTHLHCARRESLATRKIVNNSISISQYVRSQWVRNEQIGGNNAVVMNCADVERFALQLSLGDREQLRRDLGVAQTDFLLLYCGRIIPEKGVRELLDAMDGLRGYPIKLLLIGSVAFSSNISTDFQKEIISRSDQNPAVIRLGFIPNEKLPTYYSLADAQIVPSVWQEGAGLVAIEGMAAGLPLITTRSGGMVEYVNDESAIQLDIDEKLAENIANTVLSIIKDPQKRENMSAAGRERAKQFQKREYYHQFVNVFDVNREEQNA